MRFSVAAAGELPDVREMVVVVFGGEIQVVDDPDRRSEPRMRQRPGEKGRIEIASFANEDPARCAELTQDVLQRTFVMSRLVGFPVGEVRRGERRSAGGVVVKPRKPQRLEIRKMAGVLLRRPACAILSRSRGRWAIAEELLEARGAACEPRQEIREERHGRREVESALEPGNDAAHGYVSYPFLQRP